jgi:hypothetical protein
MTSIERTAYPRLKRRPSTQELADVCAPTVEDLTFVSHVRSSPRRPSDTALDVTPRTLCRHHEQIRTHLQVKNWGPEARHATIVAVHRAAQVMDHSGGPDQRRHRSTRPSTLRATGVQHPRCSGDPGPCSHAPAFVYGCPRAIVRAAAAGARRPAGERSARAECLQRAEASAQTAVPVPDRVVGADNLSVLDNFARRVLDALVPCCSHVPESHY